MDLKRLLFVIPLAVLAYLLIMQWNQDYGQNVVNNPAPEMAASSGSNDNGEGSALSAPTDSNGNAKPIQDDMPAGAFKGWRDVQARKRLRKRTNRKSGEVGRVLVMYDRRCAEKPCDRALFLEIIVALFPQLVTWLPATLYGPK